MIPAILILSIVVVGGLVYFNPFDPTPDSSQQAEEPPQQIPHEEPVTNKPEEQPIKEYVYNNVITYSLEGEIWLYDKDGNLVDTIDLKQVDYVKLKEHLVNPTEVVETEVPESDNANEKEIRSKDAKNEESTPPELINEENIETVVEENVNIEEPVDAINPIETQVVMDHTAYLMENAVVTEFDIVKSINNKLFFVDKSRKTIISVDSSSDRLKIDIVAEKIKPENIASLYKGDVYFAIAYKTGLISLINVNDMTEKTYDFTKSEEYKEIGEVSYIYIEDNLIFITAGESLVKTNIDFSTFEIIKTGDTIVDMFVYLNNMYLINEFGFDTDNSVILQINKEDLTVTNLIELKGIYSKNIGFNENLVYIRQSEFIKEIDLMDFKPEKAYKREAGSPVLVKGNLVYLLKDGQLSVSDITDKETSLRVSPASGYSIFIPN